MTRLHWSICLIAYASMLTANIPRTALVPSMFQVIEGFWHLQPVYQQADWLARQESIGSLGSLRTSVQYAYLDDDLFQLLHMASAREKLKQILLAELSNSGYAPVLKVCPFCHLKPDRLLMGNDLALAFRDSFPVSLGHTLIIPRRHEADYFQLTGAELAAIHDLCLRCKAQLDQEYHPHGFNVGVNIGESAGQTIFHCHVHLIPRYTGDVANPRGGVRGVIPSKREY